MLLRSILGSIGLFLVGCSSPTLVDRWSPEGGEPEAPAEFRRNQAGQTAPESGEWWKSFQDPTLDALMVAVEAQNPNVRAAAARLDQANAVLNITGAQRFPTLRGDASYTVNRDSINQLRFPIDGVEFDNYRVALNASWEVDLWGRIRGAYKRDKLTAEATREQYQDALLSTRATLARQYFALRYTEKEIGIFANEVAVRQEAVDLQNSRFEGGAGSSLDVARAETELKTARSQAQGLQRTHGKLENAIAVLAGKAPSDFVFDSPKTGIRLPKIPSGLPSELLERRPDLRAAQNSLLAASQQVGITKADFLPRLSLTGVGGMASLSSSDLFSSGDSLFFNLGPELDVPIFQAGRRGASTNDAKAKWDESAENYRSALLTAVREVEDSLVDLQVLRQQTATQQEAVDAATRATSLARRRFDKGAASYFEVVDAQRTELQARRTANALQSEQATSTVQLIQALGGDW